MLSILAEFFRLDFLALLLWESAESEHFSHITMCLLAVLRLTARAADFGVSRFDFILRNGIVSFRGDMEDAETEPSCLIAMIDLKISRERLVTFFAAKPKFGHPIGLSRLKSMPLLAVARRFDKRYL